MFSKKSICIAAAAGIISASSYAGTTFRTLNLKVFNNTQDSLISPIFTPSGPCTVSTSAQSNTLRPGSSPMLVQITVTNASCINLEGSLFLTDQKTQASLSESVFDPSVTYQGRVNFSSPTNSKYTSQTLNEEYYQTGSSNRLEVPSATIAFYSIN